MIRKGNIIKYRTHYELLDYNLGDLSKIENDLTLWDNTFTRNHEKKYKYIRSQHKLYIPSGYSEHILSIYSNREIIHDYSYSNIKECSFRMKCEPNSDLQVDSIDFLTGDNKYEFTKQESQLILSLPTGEGKTYVAVAAISKMGVNSMIIVNRDLLKKQWISRISEFTNLKKSNILDINSSSIMDSILENGKPMRAKLRKCHIFLVTHSLLRNYLKNKGMNGLNEVFNILGIGCKVFDEAHLEFDSTLEINYATNVLKTIYLSATYLKSDRLENEIFKKSFEDVERFVKYNPERSPYTSLFVVDFLSDSCGSLSDELICGPKGFSGYKYIEYELMNGSMMYKLRYILEHLYELFGFDLTNNQIVVLSAMKESCDILKDYISCVIANCSIVSFHSGNKISRDELDNYDIICGTSKMFGTGQDLKKMRCVIDLEPTQSEPNILQKFGRLREHTNHNGEVETSYYFALFDICFSRIASLKKRMIEIVKKAPSCKSITIVDNNKWNA